MAWRWAAASEIGTSHLRTGDRLQDAYTVSALGDHHIFAAVSDGAGSAEFGAFGAWIICRHLKVCFRDWLKNHDTPPEEETIIEWIDHLRDRISALAKQRESASRQFAATVAALLILPREILAIQVGDSAIVGRRGSDWEAICWPENGEYASSTYFVTDDPRPRLNIIRMARECNAFALFSDGVGEIALSYQEQLAHPGFFNPIIRPVDTSSGVGFLAGLSEKLSDFLAGPSVCEKTDDDKTLVLLSDA